MSFSNLVSPDATPNAGRPLSADCVEKVLFWLETLESAVRFRVVGIGEEANLDRATRPVARYAT
ncbi:hypothetical protein, partial [Burkholderia cepacia]|uniref:hypothetical protein n=1 Tax=Burkholderia cepacia TaxID=292 RepID=UPI00264F2324